MLLRYRPDVVHHWSPQQLLSTLVVTVLLSSPWSQNSMGEKNKEFICSSDYVSMTSSMMIWGFASAMSLHRARDLVDSSCQISNIAGSNARHAAYVSEY